MKLSEDLTQEDKDTFVEMLYEGADPSVAAREIGSTGTQFKHLYSPRSQYYDEAFAERVAAAKNSQERVQARIDKLDGYIWTAAEKLERWAVEKLLITYHPDFEHLRHQNLRVTGSIEHTARLLLPHMTTEEVIERLEKSGMSRAEIDQRVETLKREKEPLMLPAAS